MHAKTLYRQRRGRRPAPPSRPKIANTVRARFVWSVLGLKLYTLETPTPELWVRICLAVRGTKLLLVMLRYYDCATWNK